jgi:DNA (cytosine-5)-methyltransferase 1
VVTRVSEGSSSSARVSSEHVLTVLDLFAGAGGLTAGLHAGDARLKTVCAVELDAEAAASYTQNFGDIVYVGDVADWMDRREVPAVDVVVGGPPCQGFSTLGKQDVSDDRNVLWRHYVEAVRRARPRAFVLENVPTFLSSREFQRFVDLFEDEGVLRDYRFEAGVLNAADFGAAQARRRAVIVGTHRDIDHPGLPFPDEDVPARTVRDAFAEITPFTGVTELPHRRVVFQGRSLPGVFRSRELHIGRDYSDLALARIRSIPYGGGRFDLPHALEAECWRRHRTGAGDVMGRLTWEKPSVTIRTEFFKPEKGRYLHPTQHRAITHFEAARLQGFPDDYEFVGTRTSIARQIGNAVPIPLGAALGRHLGAALS